jgi:thiol-disulfide isomerase/thioredoxin
MGIFRYAMLAVLFASPAQSARAADPSAEELRYVKEATKPDALELISAKAPVATESSPVRVSFFFASWCGFCKKLHPKLDALQQKYYRSGVRIVGVSTEEKIMEARKYAEADKGLIPLYFLKEEKRPPKPESLGVYPVVTVQDAKGRVVAMYTGYQEERFGQLEKAIRWTLKKE